MKKPSVIDVGCGTGSWASVFEKHGCSITGIDGDYVNVEKLLIPKENFIAHNLAEPLEIAKKFDLAISLEVAEHLPPEKAESFINTLTSLSDIVLFSAAAPHQSGICHTNCQWPSYWIKIFTGFGYKVTDCVRPRIWNDSRVAPYYAQNMLLYYKETEGNKLLFQKVSYPPPIYDIINPRFWQQVNEISYFKFFNYAAQIPVLTKLYRRFKYKK